MYLDKVLLKDFGQFHNKELEPAPGINVVRGDDDGLMADFSEAMLYGIKPSFFAGDRVDPLEKRRPSEQNALASGSFAGKFYMVKDGKRILVEREFLKRNPGLSSRIAFNIEFEDYNIDELCDITKLILKQNELKITPKAMDKLRANYEKAMKTEGYGNGRYVRKMLEEAQMNLALRLSKKEHSDITKKDLITLRSADIPEYKESDEGTQSAIGFVA